MDSERGDEFIDAGLDLLGIEVDEAERAVIAASHRLFWPGVLELLALDLGEVEPEADPDLSLPPRGAAT
jgi:hypothetical protein